MKMLVVVDYQNDFVNGVLGFPNAENLEAGIVGKVKEYSDNGDLVVFTLDTHDSHYLDTREGRHLPIPHCIKGSNGWKLYGAVRQIMPEIKNRIIICKRDNFGVSPYDMIKLPDNVYEIEFVGLVSNMCVLSNIPIFQARYPNSQIYINSMLCDSPDKEAHQMTFALLEKIHVKII